MKKVQKPIALLYEICYNIFIIGYVCPMKP